MELVLECSNDAGGPDRKVRLETNVGFENERVGSYPNLIGLLVTEGSEPDMVTLEEPGDDRVLSRGRERQRERRHAAQRVPRGRATAGGEAAAAGNDRGRAGDSPGAGRQRGTPIQGHGVDADPLGGIRHVQRRRGRRKLAPTVTGGVVVKADGSPT